MAVLTIDGDDAVLMWSQRDADVATDDGRKFKVGVREVYQVVTEIGDGPEVPLTASQLPNIGDTWATTSQIRCKQHRPTQVGPAFWHVEVNWEGEIGPGGIDDSPLNDPPEISWSNAETDEAIDQDRYGNPIVTANGERIEGVTMKISDLVLTIKRNYAGINLAATHSYLHSVNSDTFAGFLPGTGRLTQFNAKQVWAKEKGGYWEVTAVIKFRWPYRVPPKFAWAARVRHEGFYIRREDDRAIVKAWDANKEPSSRPVLLTSDGTAKYDPKTIPLNPDAEWLIFEKYNPLPYNTLGLL